MTRYTYTCVIRRRWLGNRRDYGDSFYSSDGRHHAIPTEISLSWYIYQTRVLWTAMSSRRLWRSIFSQYYKCLLHIYIIIYAYNTHTTRPPPRDNFQKRLYAIAGDIDEPREAPSTGEGVVAVRAAKDFRTIIAYTIIMILYYSRLFATAARDELSAYNYI